MSYPSSFGKYLLLERINVGGMAEVFKAKAFGVEGFERILAIKRILPNMAEDEEFINMFIDEARIAVQLNHANIVPIYELGRFENQYYIAMEYVPGKDLRQVFDRFRKSETVLPLPAACYIAAQACEGLDYAHHKTDPGGRPLNLIHRDVSPQNILLGYEGAVKITDFGIVKAEDRASKTQAGVLKGKFGYMSPEQVRGQQIDHRSDIFAMGILLYEGLTGKRLFIGESDFATLEKVRAAEVVKPSEHNPSIPEALDAVVLKALAREREARYASAMELHDDLQQFLIAEGLFNAKKLSALLRELYTEEIAAESAKMEEWLRMPPPSSSAALAAAADMRAAPTGDFGEGRAEKTMIFESGLEPRSAADSSPAAASTQIGQPLAAPLADVATRAFGGPDATPAPAPLPSAPMGAVPAAAPRRRRGLRWALGVGGALVVAGVATLVLHHSVPGPVGTLVVTSTPTDTLDVFMDGQKIGSKTPLIRPGVPVGEHTLQARAPGFADRAYRFDLVAGAPAEIKIELTRAGQRQEPGGKAMVEISPKPPPSAMLPCDIPQDTPPPTPPPEELGGDAVVEISSEPPLAAVRLGGVPQASTPYAMTVHDTTRPLVLEVIKTGYQPKTLTISFAPGERRKKQHVVLQPIGPDKDGNLPPGVAPAKLVVHSRPEGATIYLAGVERGVTPKEIENLDPRQSYTVELAKDGFHATEQTVKMNNRSVVTLQATLTAEKKRRPRERDISGGCGGTGGKISIMPVGIGDCKVTIGRASLGIAPVFKKDCPVGKCLVEVRCPGGKHYAVTRMLRPNSEEKIIIKPEDWQ